MKNLLNKKQGLIFLFLIMSIVLCAQGKFTVDRDKIDEMLRQKKVTTTTQTSTTKPVQKATSRPTTPVNKVVSNGNGYTVTINGVTFKMVNVQGGTFTMGATSEQGSEADSDEKPTHSLTLSSFSIGETEVTQALWQVVMGESVTQIASRNGLSTYGIGNNYPMYDISWNDCQEFIRKLNNLLSSQLCGKRFRLPTEAEWEYAARGGNKSLGYKYSGSNNIGDVAWYHDNSNIQTCPVKQKQSNELGIYDMSGSVWEWCSDWYEAYTSFSQTNPTGPSSGSICVIRGGSWFNNAKYCRSSCRSVNSPNDRSFNLGFRLALSEENEL